MTERRNGGLKVVSGGQTGVDRAALDVAIALQMPHGGWCPKGRLAEDGTLDMSYQLAEHTSPDYAARTEQNVIDSDGTLILYRARLQGGTALTNRLAKRYERPLLRVRMDLPVDCLKIQDWLRANDISVLNVAGPRESTCPGIYDQATKVLTELFSRPASLLEEC